MASSSDPTESFLTRLDRRLRQPASAGMGSPPVVLGNPPAKLPRWLQSSDSAFRWALKNTDISSQEDEHHSLEGYYRELVGDYVYLADSIVHRGQATIYRAIRIIYENEEEAIGKIDFRCVGKAWSHERRGAGVQGLVPKSSLGGKDVVLTGVVDARHIDWEYGFTSFLSYSDQHEISLKQRSPVTIIAINDRQLSKPIAANTGTSGEVWKDTCHEVKRANPQPSPAIAGRSYYYHAAPPEVRAKIKKSGLIPGKSASYGPPGVYLFRDSSFAEDYRYGRPFDVWRVDVTGLSLHPDPEDPSAAVYSLVSIGPERVAWTGTFLGGQEVRGNLAPSPQIAVHPDNLQKLLPASTQAGGGARNLFCEYQAKGRKNPDSHGSLKPLCARTNPVSSWVLDDTGVRARARSIVPAWNAEAEEAVAAFATRVREIAAAGETRVFRLIAVPRDESPTRAVRFHSLGYAWSSRPEGCGVYADWLDFDGPARLVFVAGRVTTSAIDWDETLYAMMNWPWQWEINLLDSQRVILDAVWASPATPAYDYHAHHFSFVPSDYGAVVRHAWTLASPPPGWTVVAHPTEGTSGTPRPNPSWGTYTGLRKGQLLYHGTTYYKPFTMVEGPGWVTNDTKTAGHFAEASELHKSAKWSGPRRVLVYHLRGSPSLVSFDSLKAFHQSMRVRTGRPYWDPRGWGDIICREADGWIVRRYYTRAVGGGHDIMLCEPEKWLEYVETRWIDPEPEMDIPWIA